MLALELRHFLAELRGGQSAVEGVTSHVFPLVHVIDQVVLGQVQRVKNWAEKSLDV